MACDCRGMVAAGVAGAESGGRHGSVEFVIDSDQCVGCAVCADLCPLVALSFPFQGTLPRWSVERCNGCGVCARQCPTGAIRIG